MNISWKIISRFREFILKIFPKERKGYIWGKALFIMLRIKNQ